MEILDIKGQAAVVAGAKQEDRFMTKFIMVSGFHGGFEVILVPLKRINERP